MSDPLLKKRIKTLRSSNKDGQCVVYVMSRDQRINDNHALLAAQKHAVAKKLPLSVVFSLYSSSGHRTYEQYQFMLEGLRAIESELAHLNIAFSILVESGKQGLIDFIHHTKPDAVYFDFNPLRGPQKLQQDISSQCDTSMYVVDTHNIIPCWFASDKKEFSAATFRPKVHKAIEEFLVAPDTVVAHPHGWDMAVSSFKDVEAEVSSLLSSLPKTNTTYVWSSGEAAALDSLHTFIKNGLEGYAELRNDPANDALSSLSPYLHFGQISSLRVALELQVIVNQLDDDLHILRSPKMPKAENFDDQKVASAAALLEEMVVRKELSDNFCYYEKEYTKVSGAADWAQQTIREHDTDQREHLYSKEQLENAETHDLAWNAAQRQLTRTGKMHGYMRMYWAKKVKEWSADAQTAIDILVELNDRYSIDGGDPNGYTGIMWSVCGVHDRPWTERKVFGKIRYMNYAGLKRKFDIEAYERKFK